MFSSWMMYDTLLRVQIVTLPIGFVRDVVSSTFRIRACLITIRVLPGVLLTRTHGNRALIRWHVKVPDVFQTMHEHWHAVFLLYLCDVSDPCADDDTTKRRFHRSNRLQVHGGFSHFPKPSPLQHFTCSHAPPSTPYD
jgi:hypothetical protein